MDAEIVKAAQALKDQTTNRRGNIHKHAETAWTEFRKASIVANTLGYLGYQVSAGDEVVEASAMMDVASREFVM